MITNKRFGTHPVFFHAAGALHVSPLWPAVEEFLATHEPVPVRDPAGIYTVLTWQGGTGDYWVGKSTPLLSSMERLGVPVTVLGRERETWRNTMKIETLREALDTIRTPYFIGSDLTDVLVTGDPMSAVDLLERSDADLIYCAEDLFWPGEMEEVRKAERAIAGEDALYPYLNSGLFVGRTEACKDLIDRALQLVQEPTDDAPHYVKRGNEQPVIKELYVEQHPRVQLDFRSEVFQLITRKTPEDLDIPVTQQEK